MWISEVRIHSFRGFRDSGVRFARRANVLIGPNNGGKSSIIRAVLFLQENAPVSAQDVRLSADSAQIEIQLEDLDNGYVFKEDRKSFSPNGSFAPLIYVSFQRDQPSALL